MTLNELYEKTLKTLGVLGSGETAEADDITLVTESFTELAAELGIPDFRLTEGTGIYLATMLAADLADDFQLPEQKVQRLLATRRENRRQVMMIINDDYDTDTVIEAGYI